MYNVSMNSCSRTPTKFGFYDVNGYKTFSKLEAIELQQRSGHWPHWNFNQEVFNTLNWELEPDIDLWEMYKARARQIRNSYDYCVIFYSGGSDSHNLLNAWIDADCKIDEIASFWNEAGTHDPQSFMCSEISNVVLPDVKLLKSKGFDFVYRLIDLCDLTNKFIKENYLHYHYHVNQSLSPNNVIKSYFRHDIKDYKDLINQGKSVCFIWGSDKPQIFNDEQGYYFAFLDIMDNCVSPYVQNQYQQGWYDELFYWSPDFPLIPVKQAHVVKKFLDNVNDPSYYQKKHSPYGYNKTINQYISVHTIKKIIYPKWHDDIFMADYHGIGRGLRKPNFLTYSERDEWLFYADPDLGKKTLDMIASSIEHLPDYWRNKDQKTSAVKAHIQKHYFAK